MDRQMPSAYRIKDWDVHFEKNRTRELKAAKWFPVPNKYDGDGYTQLMEHANGDAIYGAWMTMLGVASRCNPRGSLVRNDGRPFDAKSLSRITRIPPKTYNAAFPVLVSIDWLETYELPAATSQEGAGLSQEGAARSHKVALHNNTIQDNTEQDISAMPTEFPVELRTTEFRTAWMEWEKYKRESRKPLKPTTIIKQLKFLAGLGAVAAVASINQSIANGWVGLFAPDAKNGPAIKGGGMSHDEGWQLGLQQAKELDERIARGR